MLEIKSILNCSLQDGGLIFDSQNILRVIFNGKIIFEYDITDKRENNYKVIKNDKTEITSYIIDLDNNEDLTL